MGKQKFLPKTEFDSVLQCSPPDGEFSLLSFLERENEYDDGNTEEWVIDFDDGSI